MRPHELVYKLLGAEGTIAVSVMTDGSKWREKITGVMPGIRWKEGEAAADALPWIDFDPSDEAVVTAAVEQCRNFRASVLVTTVDRSEQLSALALPLAEAGLYVEEVVTLEEEDAVALVLRQQKDVLVGRLLTELALVHFAHARDWRALRALPGLRATAQRAEARVAELEELLGAAREQVDTAQQRLLELSQRLREEESRAMTLQRHLQHQTNRARSLRQSFSYRFGNLFVLAARHPSDLLLLLPRVAKMLLQGVQRRYRRAQRRKANEVVEKARTVATPAAHAHVSPRMDGKLQELLAAPAGDAEVAAILHPVTSRLLGDSAMLQALHPNTWSGALERARLILADSFQQLAATPWQHALAGSSLGYPGHLIDLLEHARSQQKPAVLVLTSAAHDYGFMSDIYPLFSHVVVPVGADLHAVVSSISGKTRAIRSCWPAARPDNARGLAGRKCNPAGYLVIEAGAVFRIGFSRERVQIASVIESVPESEVFAHPLIVNVPGPEHLDLRVFELIAKGAIPICHPPLRTALAHYQVVIADGVSLERAASNLIEDGEASLQKAVLNVIAAGVHDNAQQLLRDIQGATGVILPVSRAQAGMTAIINVDSRRIEPLVAMLDRQSLLPENLVLITNAKKSAQAFASRLGPEVHVRVANSIDQATDEWPADECICFMDGSCHYGRHWFATAWQLHLSGLANAYIDPRNPRANVITTAGLASSVLEGNEDALREALHHEMDISVTAGSRL